MGEQQQQQESLAEEQRLEALRAEIAMRLEPVCSGWPVEMFDEMVRGLAAITMKYERRDPTGVYDRRSSDRLEAEMKALVERSHELRNLIVSPDSTKADQR